MRGFKLKILLATVWLLALAGAPGALAATKTVVSLTFDDGRDSQYVARSILSSRSMKGTFYVNSNHIGTASHMTWGQVYDLASDGNEIAGHTLDHIDLTTVTSAEAQRQVCEDRAELLNRGFVVKSFAYPYGAGYNNTTIRTMIQGCGYNSARRSWGLRSYPDCSACPYAELLPGMPGFPPYQLKTAPSLKVDTSLETIKSYVTQAEQNGGGWVPIVFHSICDGCDTYSTSPAVLEAFLDWLAPRTAQGTVVQTVNQVIGGVLQPSPGTADTTPPVSSITCNSAACTGGWYAGPVTVALSATDTGTSPSGVEAIRYTADGSTPTLGSPVYSGPLTISSTATVRYRAWDNAGNAEAVKSTTISIDTDSPTSSIACNGAPCSANEYSGSVNVSLTATDVGSGVDVIRYTTDGSDPATGSPIYSGPFTVSATTTVNYRAWDVAGNVEPVKAQVITVASGTPVDGTPPSSTISCNGSTCGPGWYTSSVQVALSAVDDASGVNAIRYTTNGSEPTVDSPVYAGPFTVSSTTTVKYRAWDNAGNVEATNSVTINVDTTAPSVAITSPANGALVRGVVKVTASATDAGSGVANVVFYVDGIAQATVSSPPYRFNWNANKATRGQHTLYAVATDVAGNKTTSAPVTVTVG